MQRLGDAITAYHAIPKTDCDSLGKRIALPAGIADAAEQYPYKFNVDLNQAKVRVTMRSTSSTRIGP